MRREDIPDYYEILGVPRDASQADINKSYRKIARDLHPDVSNEDGAEDRFKEVSQAYRILSDEDERRKYDQISSGSFSESSNVEDFFRRHFNFDFSPFGNMNFTHRSSNSDIEAHVPMTLQELLDGKPGVSFSYQRTIFCPSCDGEGGESDKCDSCDGRGFIDKGVRFRCNKCSGTGAFVKNICSSCGGKSVIREVKNFAQDLPRGMNVKSISVPGQGNHEIKSAPPGNLVLRPKVHLEGNISIIQNCNIQMQVPIDPVLFVVGGKIAIEGPFKNQIEIEVPKKAEYGHAVKIEDEGLFINDESRGFLLFRLVPGSPEDLSEEQETMLTEYIRSRGMLVEAGVLSEEEESEMEAQGGV